LGFNQSETKIEGYIDKQSTLIWASLLLRVRPSGEAHRQATELLLSRSAMEWRAATNLGASAATSNLPLAFVICSKSGSCQREYGGLGLLTVM
jgi:hypothetical protein